MRKPFILGIIIMLISCQNKRETEIDREIQVINDIFQQLSEEFNFQDNYPIPPPLPPKGIDYDTAAFELMWSRYESKISKIKYDTSIVFIALNDTLINENWTMHNLSFRSNDSIFSEYLPILNSLSIKDKVPYPIDIHSITETGKYKLRSIKEFPKGRQLLRQEYDFNFGGILELSRIYFNDKDDKALLNCEYVPHVDGGSGYILFLKKDNLNWIIVNKQMVWIS